MQWSAHEHAGFTHGTPWLPLPEDYREINVEAERDDPDSMLSLYRRLIEMRRREPALSVGSFAPVGSTGSVLSYLRQAEGRTFLIALNLGHGPGRVEPEGWAPRGRVVLGTHRDREGRPVEGHVELRDSEGVVILLEARVR